MTRKFDAAAMFEFCNNMNALRQGFPEFAKELDKCLFEIMKNHTPRCGHASCSCETMTAEQFHIERNLKFGTTDEVNSYEFN
jgi:hypothetical protein